MARSIRWRARLSNSPCPLNRNNLAREVATGFVDSNVFHDSFAGTGVSVW